MTQVCDLVKLLLMLHFFVVFTHKVLNFSSNDHLLCTPAELNCSVDIPYSGKFSWEKIFANFANYMLFAKILSANVLFLLTKIGL